MIVVESLQGHRLIGRLDRGAELIEALLGLCAERGVTAGEVRAYGTVDHVELANPGPPGVDPQRATPRRFVSPFTVVDLRGRLGERDGKLSAEVTALLSREGENGVEVVGGRLLRARGLGVEFVVEAWSDVLLQRNIDGQTGVPLLQEAIEVREAPRAAVANAAANAAANTGTPVETSATTPRTASPVPTPGATSTPRSFEAPAPVRAPAPAPSAAPAPVGSAFGHAASSASAHSVAPSAPRPSAPAASQPVSVSTSQSSSASAYASPARPSYAAPTPPPSAPVAVAAPARPAPSLSFEAAPSGHIVGSEPVAHREERPPTPPAPVEPATSWAEVARSSAARGPVDTNDEDEEPLRGGDVIEHPKFGRCEVERIEGAGEYAQVRLRNRRTVRLSLDVLQFVRDGLDEQGHRLFRAVVGR